MVIRHVNTFSKTVQVNNVYVNRWQPQQQAAPKIKGGGTNWAMLGGLFMGLAQGIGGALQTRQTQAPVQQQPAGPTAEDKTAKQKAELQKAADVYGYTIVDNNGEYTALKAGEEPIKGDFATVINGMAAKNTKPSQKQQAQADEIGKIKQQAAEVLDGAGGNNAPKEKYDVNEIKSEYEAYTIKAQAQSNGNIKGDTWSSLALSKYDIPQGVTLKDVYTALAKANYDGNDFNEAMKAGIHFNAGDQIKLPKELNINGKIVKLKDDWKISDTRATYTTATSNYHAATVQQVGSKWQVVNSKGVQQGDLYDTKEAADAAAKKLSEGEET